MSDEYESVLFIAREVYVYRIPARTSSEGYRAANWAQPLWKGRIRVIEQGSETPSKCVIRLEDSNNGDLFALAPYAPTKVNNYGGVEPVLDSSRYFVLTVVDQASGAKAFLGMGFPERTESFDFNVALQDWSKRQTVTQSKPDEPAASSPHNPPPGRDFSLKPGETISIKLGGPSTKKKSDATGGMKGGGSFGGGGFMLPPPPAPAPRGK